MKQTSLDDTCQDCIYWLGDSSAEQGECMHGDIGSRRPGTSRYDSCVNVLTRHFDTPPVGEWEAYNEDN